MTVLRRLDAVLEPTKRAVLDMKAMLDAEKIVQQEKPLRAAARYSRATRVESNIRRWIIESGWLEAIVALPLNLEKETEGLLEEIIGTGQ